ncbi:MAG: hypothetical protein JJE55_12880 [Flavobacteriaceae bacterium]|nr:hypothetical protein [Flavobacteriaceae bacterium]
MLHVIQEVIDTQTKIVFHRMSDHSILLEVPGQLSRFSKKNILEWEGELNLSQFKKKEVIEAFERVEAIFLPRQNGSSFIDMDPIY